MLIGFRVYPRAPSKNSKLKRAVRLHLLLPLVATLVPLLLLPRLLAATSP
jgi:hypothetical protein